MAIINIGPEDSAVPSSLIKEMSFDDKTAVGTIKLDYYYLSAMAQKIMDKIPESSLDDPDSLGETVLRNFLLEFMQLTDKLIKISQDCATEQVVEEANSIFEFNRDLIDGMEGDDVKS